MDPLTKLQFYGDDSCLRLCKYYKEAQKETEDKYPLWGEANENDWQYYVPVVLTIQWEYLSSTVKIAIYLTIKQFLEMKNV